MIGELRYPFQLTNAFFVALHFDRPPSVPKEVQLELSVLMRLDIEKLPKRLQIALKVETAENQPVSISTELVGLFDLVDGQPEPSLENVYEFVNNRALFMLFPLVRNMIRQTSVGMGISPLDLKVPYYFDFNLNNEGVDNSGVLKT